MNFTQKALSLSNQTYRFDFRLMNTIRHITLKFTNEIKASEVVLLRGAINNALGQDRSFLFHNHIVDGYRYSYPLIQYKRIHKKAAIVCLEQGADDIGQLFAVDSPNIKLGDRDMALEIESLKSEKTLVQIWKTTFNYHIRDWLPLNSKNYAEYRSFETLTDKIILLERILLGNLLSFLKGVGIRIDGELCAKITQLDQPRIVRYKGISLMAFNVNFSTNLSLPNYIGIGKDASTGFGIVTKLRDKPINIQTEIQPQNNG